MRKHLVFQLSILTLCFALCSCEDGTQKITFLSDRVEDQYEIYLMNPDGSSKKKISDLSGKIEMDGSRLFWSPDGSRILFGAIDETEGDREIYLIDEDGSNLVNLTNNVSEDGSPSWAPDGNQIVFISDRDGHADIYSVDTDGTNLTRLTVGLSGVDSPSFSPDGKKIVFSANRQIYLMDADGSNQVNLSNEFIYESTPCFSPDGTQILFHRWQNDSVLAVMDIDGSNRKTLFDLPGDDIWGHSYSPDGSKIAFTHVPPGGMGDWPGYMDIYVINADGANPIKLAETHSLKSAPIPSWSPDSSQLIFSDFDGGEILKSNICKMDVDGTSEKVLLTAYFPAVSTIYPVWRE